MSRSSVSEDIHVFTGLELYVHSMHIMRFSSTLQVNITRLKTLPRYSIIA